MDIAQLLIEMKFPLYDKRELFEWQAVLDSQKKRNATAVDLKALNADYCQHKLKNLSLRATEATKILRNLNLSEQQLSAVSSVFAQGMTAWQNQSAQTF